MNEASKNPCGCNPCVGPSCTCGCRNAAAANVGVHVRRELPLRRRVRQRKA